MSATNACALITQIFDTEGGAKPTIGALYFAANGLMHIFVDSGVAMINLDNMKAVDANNSDLLGGIADIAAGYPFRGKIDDLPDGEVAVIQMRNADPVTGIDWPNLSRVELPRASAKAFLGKGDIILSTRGGRNIAHCIEGRQEQVVCSPHFFVIRSKRRTLLPEFLAWQLNQKAAQDHFAAGATGSYILNLKREVVEQLPIVVPPLTEQHCIVEFDKAAKAERALLTRLIENRTIEMAAIAKSLLAPWPIRH